jgi:hypothetical protein
MISKKTITTINTKLATHLIWEGLEPYNHGRGSGTINSWNKKAEAGNMLMIIPFLLLLIIIGVGIWIGTGIFFNADYDFREVDSQALSDLIHFCLTNSDIDWTLSDAEVEKSFYQVCKINEEVIKSHFGIEIKVNDELKIKWLGDPTQCELAKLNKNFPRCQVSVLYKLINQEEIKISILAGSNQKSRRLIA